MIPRTWGALQGEGVWGGGASPGMQGGVSGSTPKRLPGASERPLQQGTLGLGASGLSVLRTEVCTGSQVLWDDARFHTSDGSILDIKINAFLPHHISDDNQTDFFQ